MSVDVFRVIRSMHSPQSVCFLQIKKPQLNPSRSLDYSTYHRVEEWMLESLFCCDSLLHVHNQALSDQILGILCKTRGISVFIHT